ncbi:NADPH-dependent FMN reductase [Streptomyces alkaliterrae]|uniref:NAD(P)H-dependent oxidoreductase n=1 Tax=Streptomyces alkaliterrae TaxID=2213162 RepID=A0A5P0YWV9_9ACTN|nr:NAD(P)H-dependent oxidoreductase [Streptomyces alkaliterrae]MBB1252362.1 NAD(P)H-dependent oxidoreductase [Streptomyces alkaliterrae]MBB1257613.1 NAD(P)H-dependent oxidoreductase [Streptomyces alkaliterrae]MQS02979.1 NADPH-dependent FMN reductase [Streptomyces alkaliterrae]
MTDRQPRLAVIIGSVRDGRFGPTVASWFAERATEHGRFEVDLIDLADHPLPVVMPAWGGETDPAVDRVQKELGARLTDADAFVVVTPEYNHSFPAALKNVIDWYREEWFAKPVGLVSYGGQSGGIRAAEQLRQVFPEMHALTVRDALSFHNAWEVFGSDGQPKDAEATAAAAKNMLGQLEWWATTLGEGREKRPYGA